MLLAYPTLPATSKHDPHVPVPLKIFDLHQTMLWVKGFDVDAWPTPSELVAASLLIQHWEGAAKLRADVDCEVATTPGRVELMTALRAMDCPRIFAAVRRCVEETAGLPEIADEWSAIMRLCENQ